MKIKIFFKNLLFETGLGEKHFRFLVLVLGIFFFATTLIQFSLEIRQTSTAKGILFSIDNDSGRAIQTARLSHWYKSNHFAPYGNLYFRLAHTLAKISPGESNPEYSREENEDIRHHFALALTSLFSLALLCYFISYLLIRDPVYSVLLGNVLFHIGIIDNTWTYFIYRAHPDLLLMLMVSFAVYFTIRYSENLNRRDFILAGLTWGLATATKTVTILFIPSFLYLFYSQGLNRENFRKGVSFVGYMLLSYLIIGFPQNFGFYKHIKFLVHESNASRMANWDSIILFATLIFDQTKYLFLAFIPIHILFGKQEKILSRRFLVFALIALVILFSRRMIMLQIHHPMPFVAMILLILIFSVKYLPTLNFKYKKLALLVTTVATLILMHNFPESVPLQKAKQLECRAEIRAMLQKVKSIQSDGKSFLVRDPYFPFDSSNPRTRQIWGVKAPDLDATGAHLFGTKKSFGDEAFEFHETERLAYVTLGLNSFSTPAGRRFEKIAEDRCGLVLFQVKE